MSGFSRSKTGTSIYRISMCDRELTEPHRESGGFAMQKLRMHQQVRIADRIRRYIVENILFGDEVEFKETVSFQESGIIDSLGFLELITFVEEEYGFEIADEELIPENFDTLRKVSGFVEKKLRGEAAV